MTEPTAASYGVGARVSLYPMCDGFVDVIMGALEDAAPAAASLTTTTSPVSTFAGGGERDLVRWLVALVAAAARRGGDAHLGAHILLSRGCPGEVACALPAGRPWAPGADLRLSATGVVAVADWSLYPLVDADGAMGDHMAPIMAAIARAKESGLFLESDHYVTRLRGDVADVVALVASAWLETGAHVQHVISHLVLSINSPTRQENPA